MITIKSEVRVASFEFESETFKGNGEARIDDQNTIKQVNGILYKNGAYAGSFSSNNMIEGEELKFNINGVASEDLAKVAELVNNISAELKSKYTV
jgi:hypothetical protein